MPQNPVHANKITFQSTKVSISFLRSWIISTRGITLWDGNASRNVEAMTPLVNWLLLSNIRSEAVDFIENHVLHIADILHNLEVKVKCCWAIRFIRSVMPDLEVTVLKGCLDGNTRRWVERKHFIQKVQSGLVSIWE